MLYYCYLLRKTKQKIGGNMLLTNLKEMILGKYEIIIDGNVVEKGDQLIVNGLTGWLEIKEIKSMNDTIQLIVKE